ncbi:MAG: sodium:proton antiporter [Solirubrobacterales bacterium]|nr:sodium:proton antiporter [Solirubrobacterales bacterium]HMT06011.1 sodium:proton antiporter [Solirubrobacterales bacterium]
MELSVIAVGGVVSVVAVALFSRRLGVASPLLLVVAGAAIGTLPEVSATSIQPHWILGGVLPPLLYSAAINIPNTDFRRNLKPITGLAVLLVVVSTAAAAVLFHALMPEIGWPAAFALAAVLSPTDAVAATAVGRKLGLPSRLLAILEGEGLVNDATALVLLRSAVAAMGAGVTAGGIIGDFALAVVGAVAVGAAVGVLNVRIRQRIGDPVMNTAISFVVPFVAYIPAEDFGFSGVLAVVVAGLVTSDLAARFLKAEDRITEETNWRTLAFLMEGFIFLLMGISLEDVLFDVGNSGFSVDEALLYGAVASLLLIMVRLAFVVPLVAMIKRDDKRAVDSKPHIEGWRDRLKNDDLPGEIEPRRVEWLEHRIAKASADIDFRMRESLGWRAGAVLAWSGMRGAVTVAAAQTLPVDTPYRAELVLIAYVAAALMLLFQGSTLPWVIRKFRVERDSPEELRDQHLKMMRELADAGEEALNQEAKRQDINQSIIERVRRDSLIGRQQPMGAEDDLEEQRESYIRLRIAVIEAERTRMLRHMKLGTFSSEVIDDIRKLLDLEEARLQQLSDRSD